MTRRARARAMRHRRPVPRTLRDGAATACHRRGGRAMLHPEARPRPAMTRVVTLIATHALRTRPRVDRPAAAGAPRAFPLRRAARLALAALALAGCTGGVQPASRAEREAYVGRRGTLTDADTTRVAMRGRYAVYRVRLASSTGLAVTGRLLVPARATPPFAAVLLNDGRELNSGAVDALPPDFGDVVALSLDYPEQLPYDVDVGTLLRRQGELRDAARRIPAAFSLGGAYLARRADVDSARVALVATSFAVPFAVIAASLDERFRNVALIYGAGDFPGVLAANLALRPSWLREPAARVAMRAFAEFEPARYVAAISPRPLLMVNGIDDPQMPARAVRSLYEAAREPKSIVWLRTGHLSPDDSVLIRALVDTTLARLPLLRRATAGATAGRERVSPGASAIP